MSTVSEFLEINVIHTEKSPETNVFKIKKMWINQIAGVVLGYLPLDHVILRPDVKL